MLKLDGASKSNSPQEGQELMNEGIPYSSHTEADTFTKAEYLERFIAKFIDFLVMGALFMVPGAVGPLAGTTYIIISDGFKGGQSLGKKIIGLRVVSLLTGSPADIRKSILRNSPFAVLVIFFYLVGWIPYLGKLLEAAAFLAVFGIEIALIFTDDLGQRFGDRVARTLVVPVSGRD
jgi:uncharacterized RDD family membrane protein YckC